MSEAEVAEVDEWIAAYKTFDNYFPGWVATPGHRCDWQASWPLVDHNGRRMVAGRCPSVDLSRRRWTWRLRWRSSRTRWEYLVSDGGEAASAAFLLGRDDHAFESALKKVCARHGLKPSNDGALLAEVRDPEWLFAAILAVANGAAQAAAETSTKVSERRVKQLREMIRDTMFAIVPPHSVASDYQYRGNSGRLWKIDYAVIEVPQPLLLKAIIPEPNSINANYTAFGDIAEIRDGIRRFSVFDTELKTEDKSLMLQVAELVPLAKLDSGARAALRV